MVESAFGIQALVSMCYQVVKKLNFLWKKLRVSPYNCNSTDNVVYCQKYVKKVTALKEKGTVKFYYIDKSFFASSMRNEYGYVPKGENNSISWRAAVWSVAYSMVALLGPLGIELYQMIKGSHNSTTFIKFL
ncbi:hypothetical protein DSO57_1036158 [Entomophthora muscae]|uniref:Uncharacterized protein n=1 Tax=Entomophthora muscae TaxID=34485 RepID=A0ACC2SZB4_9FUNG|nr:hypothetical protein DSO57_1036158 [Entomophthora muscae]